MALAPSNRVSLLERWRWVVVPFAIAVLSRVFSIALLLRQIGFAGAPLHRDAVPLTIWDGGWYLSIAATGYHAEPHPPHGNHDFAFHPGWPLLIRVASLGGILPMNVMAVVLSNVLFVLAAVVVYRVFVDRFGARTALLGTLLLCFNPVSYVFSMAYSEPLFLLLTALYFKAAYGRTSPIFAALATVTRLSGIAIGVSAAAMFVLDRAPRLRLFVIGAAIAGVFAVWWIYIWQLTGSFTGWSQGTPGWHDAQGIASIILLSGQHPTRVALWIVFIGIMAAGSLLLVRRHPDMAIYGLAVMAMGLIGAPVWSMPRHAMIAFPAFAALGARLGTRASLLLLVMFAVGEFVFVSLSFGQYPSPP